MKLLITFELLPLRGSSRLTSLAGGAMFFSVDVVFSVFSVAVLVVGCRDPLPSSLASSLKDLNAVVVAGYVAGAGARCGCGPCPVVRRWRLLLLGGYSQWVEKAPPAFRPFTSFLPLLPVFFFCFL